MRKTSCFFRPTTDDRRPTTGNPRPTTDDQRPLTVRAHAKVNLYLKVTRKRPDGYHDLDTLFERISLFDTLTFRALKEGISLSVTGAPGLEAGPANLVWRAATLLKERYGVRAGVTIVLKKSIPVAGGMGGGSSDAAATLLALNRFWKLGLSKKQLATHALELGSDVPFFILEAPFAAGKGRGEKLKPVKLRTKLWHVLAFPGLKVSTPEIFKALRKEDWDASRSSPANFFSAVSRRDSRALARLMKNTLETVTLSRHPLLAKMKKDLVNAGALGALVSGSGPTVFALVPSAAKGRVVARIMRRLYPKTQFCVVSTA